MTDVQSAPGELELVRQFVNTNDVDDGIEDFGSPALLRKWVLDHGLPAGKKFAERDVERAIELREALRALLLANSGEPLDTEAVSRLNDSAARVRLLVRFDEDGGSMLTPEVTGGNGAPGVDGALGAILAIVHRSMATGTWSRLKACRSDTCLWAFYDKSRNRSAHWCSMAVCGNRAKARTYRRLHGPRAERS